MFAFLKKENDSYKPTDEDIEKIHEKIDAGETVQGGLFDFKPVSGKHGHKHRPFTVEIHKERASHISNEDATLSRYEKGKPVIQTIKAKDIKSTKEVLRQEYHQTSKGQGYGLNDSESFFDPIQKLTYRYGYKKKGSNDYCSLSYQKTFEVAPEFRFKPGK